MREVVVGRVGRPHGIRGEVTVEVRTDEPQRRLGPGMTVHTEPSAAGPLTITEGRVHSGRLLLRFEGYADRGAAERLRGVLLVAEVDLAERPEDPEEFFDHQLVGLTVRTVAGELVGTVQEMVHLPGQDLLAVQLPDGTEALVPFVAELVPDVDVEAGMVVVDLPPGLLGPVPDEDPTGGD